LREQQMTKHYGQRCAVCARKLAAGRFYVVRVDVFADPAAEPIDTAAQPGEAGYVESVEELIEQMVGMSADELQDQVARRFEYHLCPDCQKLVLRNPLGLPRRRGVSSN
jgi:hypothetical protein